MHKDIIFVHTDYTHLFQLYFTIIIKHRISVKKNRNDDAFFLSFSFVNSSILMYVCHFKKVRLFITVILYLFTNKTLLKMENLVSKINECFESFKADATLQVEKGNKAAGTRARKASLELEKLLKEFRKASLDLSKK